MTYVPSPRTNPDNYRDPVPFANTEQAWFWYMRAHVPAGDYVFPLPNVSRPCEPHHILDILSDLYKSRQLTIEQGHILKHYGLRQRRPSPAESPKERRADMLWKQAIDLLSGEFYRRGIIIQNVFCHPKFLQRKTPC